ncbi:hypothetical protein ACQ86N_05740 [Puia sp. P3]|uniref:DUF7948 domain-containing protein n=1 Tax=Puia sp. P3 TaxID=3423952 RepID=UPI003D6710B0
MFSFFQLSAQSGGYSSLEFVENKGQWDTLVKFRAEMTAGSLFMQHKGFTVVMHDTNDLRRIRRLLHGDAVDGVSKTAVSSPAAAAGRKVTTSTDDGQGKNGGSGGAPGSGADPYLLHSHSYRVSFENASDGVEIAPEKALNSYNNYFIGDSKYWKSNVKIYQGILYKNMYDGIDVHYYTEMGFVKYDIIVRPGADPGKIVLKYEGQNKLTVKKNRLYVQTSVGTVQELEPHSYQITDKGRADVECNYVLLPGNRVQFLVKNYSPGAMLVIDPLQIYCTFTGSKSDNWGYTATYDNAGNFYAGGIVLDESKLNPPGLGGTGFLVSTGAFQTTFQGVMAVRADLRRVMTTTSRSSNSIRNCRAGLTPPIWGAAGTSSRTVWSSTMPVTLS